VAVEHQGLVVGTRPAPDSGRALVNIAFKSMGEETARSLRRLLASHAEAGDQPS
jgi:hypothetical protein